ncbi:MAG: site-2 protease family protein [Pseudomonadota bacterium]|nr:site-2 protease family protein [Pseudomonadota bacterium]
MPNLSTAQTFAIWVIPVLLAITLHEVAHGWVASKLGDQTAKILGRLTANPIKHIDLVGTIIVPGILLLTHAGFVFGWAKPVPVNYFNLKNPRRDMAFVAAAGPVSNLLMALFWAGAAKLGMILTQADSSFGLWLVYTGQAGVMINIWLMVLNFIPIPPLDGSRIVASLLPRDAANAYSLIEPYGFFILFAMILTNVLQMILLPPTEFFITTIYALFGM